MDVNLKTRITHQNRNGLRHQKEDIKYNKAMRYVELLPKYLSIFSPIQPSVNLKLKLLLPFIVRGESRFFTYAVNSCCAYCTYRISLRKKRKQRPKTTKL